MMALTFLTQVARKSLKPIGQGVGSKSHLRDDGFGTKGLR